MLDVAMWRRYVIIGSVFLSCCVPGFVARRLVTPSPMGGSRGRMSPSRVLSKGLEGELAVAEPGELEADGSADMLSGGALPGDEVELQNGIGSGESGLSPEGGGSGRLGRTSPEETRGLGYMHWPWKQTKSAVEDNTASPRAGRRAKIAADFGDEAGTAKVEWAGEGHDSTQDAALPVDAAATEASSNAAVCEKDIGTTCIFLNCSAWRHATCVEHKCVCKDSCVIKTAAGNVCKPTSKDALDTLNTVVDTWEQKDDAHALDVQKAAQNYTFVDTLKAPVTSVLNAAKNLILEISSLASFQEFEGTISDIWSENFGDKELDDIAPAKNQSHLWAKTFGFKRLQRFGAGLSAIFSKATAVMKDLFNMFCLKIYHVGKKLVEMIKQAIPHGHGGTSFIERAEEKSSERGANPNFKKATHDSKDKAEIAAWMTTTLAVAQVGADIAHDNDDDGPFGKLRRSNRAMLGMSALIDALGMSSYALDWAAGIGEATDLITAPIMSMMVYVLYNGRVATFGFFEEIIPFADAFPTATIGWALKFHPDRGGLFSIGRKLCAIDGLPMEQQVHLMAGRTPSPA